MSEDARWWKLYRQERSKLAPGKHGWRQELTAFQITRAAREATRRYREERDEGGPDSGVREPAPKPRPPTSATTCPVPELYLPGSLTALSPVLEEQP